MKQKGTNPQSQISEEEIVNESEKEFQVMITKMIQHLRNRMDAWIRKTENFKEEIEARKREKKNQRNNTN